MVGTDLEGFTLIMDPPPPHTRTYTRWQLLTPLGVPGRRHRGLQEGDVPTSLLARSPQAPAHPNRAWLQELKS